MTPDAITQPADCAIALAVPYEETAFLEQLSPESPREFAKWYRVENGGDFISPSALWRNAYGPREAAPIARVLEECEALGVEVDRACTLNSFSRLAERKRVVILAAHWRSGLLQPADIRDPKRFVTRLSAEPSGAAASLRAHVETMGHADVLREATLSPDDPEVLGCLVHVLAEIVRSVPLRPANSGLREAQADASYYACANREWLDETFPHELAPGAGLELCDSTHQADAVAAALGGRFNGMMDMVVCNSYLLAATIKRANPNCLLLANRDPTSPVARLLITHQVVKSLARTPGNYLQVALRIRERLRN